MVSFLVVVTVAFVASIFMAWTIGANSNSAPFAPAVGANAVPVMRAALFVGFFASLGAIVQGGSISETVGKELIRGVSITPLAAASGLLTAATFITVGNRRGYPMPAAFVVTGAIVGVGLALGGDPAVPKYQEIAFFWLSIPIAGLGIGFLTAYILRMENVPETVSIPVLSASVGFVMPNIRLTFIPSEGRRGNIARYVSDLVGVDPPTLFGSYDLVMFATSTIFAVIAFIVLRYYVRRSVKRGVRGLLIGLGAVVVFSSGGSQVGLATGPLETLFEENLRLPTIYLLFMGGIAMLLGSWMGSPRVIHSVSREYSELGVRRSISALVPAFLIIQTAIFLGLPISMNQTIISSLIGSGLVEGSAGVSAKKIGYTVGAWLFSLFSAGLVGYGLYSVLTSLLGAT